jgi:hypothetical protein
MSTTDEFRYEIESFNSYLEEKGLKKSKSEILELLQLREYVCEQIEAEFPADLEVYGMDCLIGYGMSAEKDKNLRRLRLLLKECRRRPTKSMLEAYRSFLNHSLFVRFATYQRHLM